MYILFKFLQTNIILNMPSARDLDRTDYEIIKLLQNNARLSNKALADKVGLAPSTCLGRVQSLIAAARKRRSDPWGNPHAVGVSLQAMVAVRLSRHTKALLESFRDHVLGLPEVVQLYHVAGPIDFMVHVWVRDSEHLRDLAMNAFTSREEVEHIETELIFDHAGSIDRPIFNGDGS